MIQQVQITRGGKDYTLHIGTEAGNSVLFIEQASPDEATGNPVRFYPERLTINFEKGKGRGGVAYIFTEWERGLVGVNGGPISNPANPKMSMKTNDLDQASFISAFGMPILMSMNNGFIRALLGFNNQPVFNPANGQVIAYTPEQLSAPPTHDYNLLPPDTDGQTI